MPKNSAKNTNSIFTLTEQAALASFIQPYKAAGVVSKTCHQNDSASHLKDGKQSVIMYMDADLPGKSSLWLEKAIVSGIAEYTAHFDDAHFKGINFPLFLKQVSHHARTVWPNETGLRLVHGG